MSARFVLRRLLYGAFVVLFVTTVVFFVSRVISDPARLMLPIGASDEDVNALRGTLGLDRPLLEQYLAYLLDALRLDFGDSVWQRVPAAPLALERVPVTLLLMVAGMGLAVLIAVPIGMIAGSRPGGILDRVLTSAALIGLSMPQFWLGTLLIFVFAVQLGVLPTSGRGGIEHLVLPALTLALPSAGRIAQVTRATVIDELARDYASVAAAKGFSRAYVVRRHALRNALVPIVTLVGWEFTYGLAGYAVVVETVFAWPGFGYLAIQAIRQQDVFLIQAIVFVATLIVVVMNLLIDLTYRLIDPRIER